MTKNDLNLPLPKWLSAAFWLKPYGDDLLSPQAHFWIGFVRLIVLALASIEGLSWAYVGSFLGRGTLTTWFFGSLLGMVIFIFIWGVDVSLMSLDVSEYRKAIRHKTKGNADKNESGEIEQNESEFANKFSWERTWEFIKWPVLPVGIRTLLVVISVLVTAPFISMYVLQSEIEHELLNRFQSSYELVKKTKLQSIEAQMRERQQREIQAQLDVQARLENWNKAQVAYAQEVAGKGVSGRYGDGVAARAAQMIANTNKLEYELARKRLQEIEKDRLLPTPADKELLELEDAAKNKKFDVLRVRFGILDVPDSFVARNKVMREAFEGKPEFKRVEFSVYSLLSFLAAALFLLKYFEPASVEVYFSEARQSQWREYTQGTYDHFLKDGNKSIQRNERKMSPLYFCQLWDEVIWAGDRNKDYADAANHVETIRSQNKEKLNNLTEHENKFNYESEELQKQNNVVSEKTSVLNKLKVDYKNLQDAKEITERNALNNIDLAKSQQYVNIMSGLEADIATIVGEIASATKNLSDANFTQEVIQKRKDAAEEQLQQLRTALQPVLDLIEMLDRKNRDLAQAAITRVRS
jgi:hypothetical protein